MFKYWKLTEDWALEIEGQRTQGPHSCLFQLEVLLTTKEEDHHGLRLTLQLGPFYGCVNLYNRHHAEWFKTGREWAEGEEEV